MGKEVRIYDWILRMLREGKIEEVGKLYPTIEVYTKPRLIYLDDFVGELFEVLFLMAKFGVAKLHEPPEEKSKV